MPVPISDGGEELPELVLVDEPDVVLVEAAERVPDHLLGIRALRIRTTLQTMVVSTCLQLFHILIKAGNRTNAYGMLHIIQYIQYWLHLCSRYSGSVNISCGSGGIRKF